MPILTEYTRENEAPPEPIGYYQTEIDPNDDRHDADGLEISEDDLYKALEELNGAEPHSA